MLWFDLLSICRSPCGSTVNGSPIRASQDLQVGIEQLYRE